MTLSDITGETRAILKWGGILLGALIILFFLMKVKDAIFPAPPPPPTVGFGKLPQPEFPQAVNKNLTYSINTITGTLPLVASSEKIFKMQEEKPDLLSLQRAKEKAKAIGFTENPTSVSENVYQWKDSSDKTLTMNILDFNFNFSSSFLSTENPIFNRNVDHAVGVARDFLQRMSLLKTDLDETKTTTDLLSIKNLALVPVASLSNTQAVRVNFSQKNINELPVHYTSYISPMSFLIGGPGEPHVLEANFFYQKPSEFFSTYPLKTAEEAFEDLKNGKGYISVIPSNPNVSIKKVNLGYYMAEKRQEYLLPIVIFEGDSFQAYVSAVKDEWVNK